MQAARRSDVQPTTSELIAREIDIDLAVAEGNPVEPVADPGNRGAHQCATREFPEDERENSAMPSARRPRFTARSGRIGAKVRFHG